MSLLEILNVFLCKEMDTFVNVVSFGLGPRHHMF
jgi:hypothetical protein